MTTSLLVIDNFWGDIDEKLLSVLSLEWKVIVISRNEAPSDNYPQIRLKAVKSKEALYQLFEMYLNREVSDEESHFLDKIIERVNGHTLVLELIAKQLMKSYFSIEQACSIVVERGFSDIAPEKIDYEKDSITSSDTIRNIIAELFPSKQYGIEHKRILKGVSLFGFRGIQIKILSEMLSLESLDSINELIDDQWVESDGEWISLHSVIWEVVNNWKWEKRYKEDIYAIIEYLFCRLSLESQREEKPANFLKLLRMSKEIQYSKNAIVRIWARWNLERIKRKGLFGKILIQRIERGGDEAVTDRELVTQLLSQSEAVLSSCGRIEDIKNSDLYNRLMSCVIINMPKEREEYILQCCSEVLQSKFIKHEDNTRYALYDNVLAIYAANHDYDRIWEVIQEAKHGLIFKSNNVKGFYYTMLAGLYAIRSDGACATDKEYLDRESLLKAIDKSIKYFKRSSRFGTTGYRLTQSYIMKVTTLIHLFPERKEEIENVLRETGRLCEKYTQSCSSLRREYYICRAWYFTKVEPYELGWIDNILLAYEIEKEIFTSDLDIIDDNFVPFAKICQENERISNAVGFLKDAIELCEKEEHVEMIPYIRKKIELYAYLLEIYYSEKDIENSREALKKIDVMNKQYGDMGIYYEIPAEMRESLKYETD